MDSFKGGKIITGWLEDSGFTEDTVMLYVTFMIVITMIYRTLPVGFRLLLHFCLLFYMIFTGLMRVDIIVRA